MYLPDELADRARQEGLNVSALTRAAVVAELDRRETSAWLERIPTRLEPEVSHETALTALGAARDEMGLVELDHG